MDTSTLQPSWEDCGTTHQLRINMRWTKRKAAKARKKIYEDRCPARPGVYMHDWVFTHWEEPFDYTRGQQSYRVYRCSFCKRQDA